MKKLAALTVVFIFAMASLAFAGGWDKEKGMDKITLKGNLLCVGCSLKKLNGANAECSLFAHHAVGFKTEDGTIWNIIDNAKGHDIIRAHTLLEKNVPATVTGWIYPIAHAIEIDSIDVHGVSMADIQKTAWEEDQMIAKELMGRKLGQAPTPAGPSH
ncbi:MAG TPA: hypothetical protein DD713_01010 [Nitrospiraceae bacterium]|nr:hypothetical protein [Nitrospiraceae bacterium]